jgi:hypothetical protein
VHHAEVFCDTGDVATGGGYEATGANISINRPLPFSPDGSIPHGWQAGTPATITAPPGGATITAYVVCADV